MAIKSKDKSIREHVGHVASMKDKPEYKNENETSEKITTKLGIHTDTGSNPLAYCDVKSNAMQYAYDPAFETVNDGSSRINGKERVTYSLDDKTTSDVGKVDTYNDRPLPGSNMYRQQPMRHEHTPADMQRMSGYGVVDHATKMPQYTQTAGSKRDWKHPAGNNAIDAFRN